MKQLEAAVHGRHVRVQERPDRLAAEHPSRHVEGEVEGVSHEEYALTNLHDLP